MGILSYVFEGLRLNADLTEAVDGGGVGHLQ